MITNKIKKEVYYGREIFNKKIERNDKTTKIIIKVTQLPMNNETTAVTNPATARFKKNIEGTSISRMTNTRPATTKISHNAILNSPFAQL